MKRDRKGRIAEIDKSGCKAANVVARHLRWHGGMAGTEGTVHGNRKEK